MTPQTWVGADPGGDGAFGIACLGSDGSVTVGTVSCAAEAIEHVLTEPSGAGIDCPMWWSAGPGGGRRADRWIRRTYGIASGTVQSVNSLRGAALIQGVMFADLLRRRFPSCPVTEAHPKALLRALGLNWSSFINRFDVRAVEVNEHERDAIVAAVCAREGVQGRWPRDLAKERDPLEQRSDEQFIRNLHYYWPAA